MRCLYYYLALYNIHLQVEHIPGVHNCLADTFTIPCRYFGCWLLKLTLTPHQYLQSSCNPLHQSIGLTLALLETIAQWLITDSLAASSRRTYSSVLHSSVIHFIIPVMQATEQVLLLFIVDLCQCVSHSMVWCYLAAMRHLHMSHGLPNLLTRRPW